MAQNAPAVNAATKVLEYISNQPTDVGISEICRGTGLNKNMVFRILNSYEEEGWVRCVDQKYSLTLVPFNIASKAMSKMTLTNAAYPVVYNLWQQTGESTYLGVKKDNMVSYLLHFDGTGDVRVAGRVGGEYMLYCSAPGKALLAYSDETFINEYTSESYQKRTDNTITDGTQLKKHLVEIRNNGFACDMEEFGGGITCVAAPVFDYTGNVVASVGCSAFTLNGDCDAVVERLLPYVKDAAKQISLNLGYKEK